MKADHTLSAIQVPITLTAADATVLLALVEVWRANFPATDIAGDIERIHTKLLLALRASGLDLKETTK